MDLNSVSQFFLDQGILGALLLVAGWWIYRLSNRITDLTDKSFDREAKCTASIEMVLDYMRRAEGR